MRLLSFLEDVTSRTPTIEGVLLKEVFKDIGIEISMEGAVDKERYGASLF